MAEAKKDEAKDEAKAEATKKKDELAAIYKERHEHAKRGEELYAKQLELEGGEGA